MDAHTKRRINKEWILINRYPNEGIIIRESESDDCHLIATINENINVSIKFSNEYPISPPKIIISEALSTQDEGFDSNGQLCLDVDWLPVMTISSILIYIQSALYS